MRDRGRSFWPGSRIKLTRRLRCFRHTKRSAGDKINGASRLARHRCGQMVAHREMAKSSKLVAAKRGRVLLVRRKRDGLWMFPEDASAREKAIKIACAGRSKKNFRKSNLDALRLWKEVKAKNRRSGRKMSDAIFVTAKASGRLTIGDKHEIDKAAWRKPRGIRLTPTSRYIRDKFFPKSN